jgi:hypothetical protein
VIVGSVAASGSGKSPSREIVRLNLLNAGGYFVDNDPSGGSGGDLFGSSGPLKRGGGQVGNFISTCTQASPTQFRGQCAATFRLNGRGSLQAAGSVKPEAPSYRVAIVGGTGEFKRAAGTAQIEPVGDGSRGHMTLRILRR